MIPAPLLAQLQLFAADPGTVAATTDAGPWRLVGAFALILLAAALLAVEFFAVSGGLLIAASFLAGFAGCALAFSVSPTAGWVVVALVPPLGWLAVRWGLARLVRSVAVPQAIIADDAGYRHAAAGLGVAVGSRGELVTDALPTGRARFLVAGHAPAEIDVVAHGPALRRGQHVVVLAISGPSISVAAEPAAG